MMHVDEWIDFVGLRQNLELKIIEPLRAAVLLDVGVQVLQKWSVQIKQEG